MSNILRFDVSFVGTCLWQIPKKKRNKRQEDPCVGHLAPKRSPFPDRSITTLQTCACGAGVRSVHSPIVTLFKGQKRHAASDGAMKTEVITTVNGPHS